MFWSRPNTKLASPGANGLDALRDSLARVDAVVIGAGAGLSTAAGFVYDGPRFDRYFADFARAYGFRDMYSGGFYPFATAEERWAYWSRMVLVNRYLDPPRPVYRQLLSLVQGRDYFVLTTNVDHCFQKAGVDKARLFYTQGDYGLFQCSRPCCQQTWDNEASVRRMVEQQRDLRIPTQLVPVCPRCGAEMSMNLRADQTFVEDAGWHRAAERYEDFLRRHTRGRVLYLELGVGYNTPVIIKYPFWQRTAANPDAVYACVNLEGAVVPADIAGRSIGVQADLAGAIAAQCGEKGKET